MTIYPDNSVFNEDFPPGTCHRSHLDPEVKQLFKALSIGVVRRGNPDKPVHRDGHTIYPTDCC